MLRPNGPNSDHPKVDFDISDVILKPEAGGQTWGMSRNFAQWPRICAEVGSDTLAVDIQKRGVAYERIGQCRRFKISCRPIWY